jgi:signal transduction histidine kinase
VRREPVPLGPIVAGLGATHAERLKAAGGRLELAPDAAVPLSDPTLLRQIVANLVENAIAYARAGVPPIVTVSAVVEGSGVRLSVSDNGRGIPPGLTERIFDVFTRTTVEQDLEHAGVGLATVRRAAVAMGTEIQVASEVGAGSTFWLTLPRA